MPRKVKAKLGFKGHLSERTLTIPDREPPPYGPDARLDTFSGRVPRIDGPDKVSGRARFSADVNLPGMLWGAIVRSPHPAARVLSVDLGAARKLPGVKAAVGAGVKRVFYAGDEVAAVAATSAVAAAEAARRVEVKYEVFPFVTDLEEARKPGAPKVHERGNLRAAKPVRHGDAAAAIRAAKVVVEGTYRTRTQTHTCLETHGAVAAWKGDELTLYASTQGVYATRDNIAKALKIPAKKIRVLTEHMGGGFGSKLSLMAEIVLAAKLAKAAGRPVRIMLGRKEEHLATGNRPETVQRLKLGADRGGKITALQLTSYGSGGIAGGAGTSRPARHTYDIANLQIDHTDVYTNLGPGRPFRAPGHPQGAFALEGGIDELARKLKLDPLEIRLRNTGDAVRQAQLRLGAERFGWKERERRRRQVERPWRRGFGIGSAVWYQTGRPGMESEVEVRPDGTVEVRTGAQDIGTGLRTALAVVAAEELGLTPNRVTVRIGDTRFPVGPNSGGSNTTSSLSPPTRVACFRIKEKLAGLAAEALGAKSEEIVLRGGAASVAGSPAKRVTWKKLCARLKAPLVERAQRQKDYENLSRLIKGCQFAQVRCDPETGVVRVEKVVAVQDCGLAVNRLTAESQIIGAVIQGVSYALLEERVVDHRFGKMLNPNVEQYKIAGSLDVPEIEPILFDVYLGSNATGTIGIGEPPTIPTLAAVANAVADALGVRVYEQPLTPARVLAALARQGGKR